MWPSPKVGLPARIRCSGRSDVLAMLSVRPGAPPCCGYVCLCLGRHGPKRMCLKLDKSNLLKWPETLRCLLQFSQRLHRLQDSLAPSISVLLAPCKQVERAIPGSSSQCEALCGCSERAALAEDPIHLPDPRSSPFFL